jgi:ketosteroid isomerase-like protein
MIEPAVATTARMLPQLWTSAVSAGDVEAVWSLYATDAVLVPWHLPAVRGTELHAALAWLAELRLPVYLHEVRASATGSEVLLHAQWSGPPARASSTAARKTCDAASGPTTPNVSAERRWRPHGPGDTGEFRQAGGVAAALSASGWWPCSVHQPVNSRRSEPQHRSCALQHRELTPDRTASRVLHFASSLMGWPHLDRFFP